MDEHSLALGPKLAWQPAEAAFKAETTAAADESRRATVNFDEERRSTLTVPMGAHPKDVQWNRIRELTENLQKEREISASLTTRFHDFQRDAAAQQRQMQQIVETKELTARAQTAELEAYREAVRNRELQLHDDVARLQARAITAELHLEGARAQLAAMAEAKAAEEQARLAALAKAQAEKEARENDEDALEGNERGLEMVERALVNALRAAGADASGESDVAASEATRETVETMIGEGRSGGQIASTLIEQALGEGRRVAELGANDLARRWKEERAVRRQLQNALQELKGSIRVMCRVRPLSSAERANGEEEVVQPSNDMACTLIDPSKPGARKHFGYDRVFAPSASQVDVFEEVEPLVPAVFDGYNLCVFAYGQTGSGKTHTMQGSADEPGLGPRLLGALFSEAAERRALAATSVVGKPGAAAAAADADNWVFTVSVSYLEVYNEQVRDLLAPGAKPTVVDVRQGTANEISIPGLTSVVVADESEVNDTLRLGASKRAVGATSMNAHSSRSHSLILATIVGRHAGSGATSSGKLYLVDLAGSERVSRSGVCGEQMKEAQNINRSLSALGDVMAALQAKQAHVPYRNSKLTQLLSDSLGGRSKSIMFVNVSPAADSACESLCSLNFAARVGNVELATTKRSGGGGGGGANGSALALKLSRETEDKLRAELLDARERVGAAERRVADAQRALADEQARASEGIDEARSEREGVEFAARAELDRLSSQLSLEARQRELSEAALAKSRDGSSAALHSLRLELERTRAELARAQDAAAIAMAVIAPAAEERKQPPTDVERAAAVAALRQQAVAARAAVSAGTGFAPSAQATSALAPTSAPQLALAPPAPAPLAPAAACAPSGVSSSVSKIVSFFEPAPDAKSPPPAQRAAIGALAGVVDATPSATPTRGLSARAPGGTPRAAAQQMRLMPAVQALYGADALGSLDDLNMASDSLPAPMLPTSVWAAPQSTPLDAGAEKENAANDARSTATGQLVPWAISGHTAAAEAAAPPPLKSSLKATSTLGMNPITIPIKFAPMPAVHAQQAADTELHKGMHGMSQLNGSGIPSYLDQTKSSSAHTSRFPASSGLSSLGSAQRVVAGKARAEKTAQPRESEAGGRRMSLIARQSVPTGDSLRRKAGESQPPALGSLSESYGATATGANKKPRRF